MCQLSVTDFHLAVRRIFTILTDVLRGEYWIRRIHDLALAASRTWPANGRGRGRPVRNDCGSMVKPVGANGNMACAYCFCRRKRRDYARSQACMDRRILERFIKHSLAVHPGPVVHFTWQGGEPLLAGRPFFGLALRLQQRHAPAGKVITTAVQANATLIDRDFARFFAQNHVLVGVSLDDPAPCHAASRCLDGRPSRFLRDAAGTAIRLFPLSGPVSGACERPASIRRSSGRFGPQ